MLRIWEAVYAGEIDTIGTDHCSFSLAEKLKHADDFSLVPNGCAGIQHRGQLLYTYGVRAGRITIEQMVALLSTNVAALFGVEGRGAVREGNFSDLVIWDPHAQGIITDTNHSMDCDISIYAMFNVVGAARDVLVNGIPVVRQGVLAQEGIGQYLPCIKSARYRKA
ncbi:MAG: amidohydrolase family protein [Candidatus Pelethousia sp.]|nr:amidohydrolase family protein [Candidatus Pelethousia sp.]